MVQMAMIYETMSKEYATILESVNYVFTAIFFFEAVLKLIAFGKSYFKNSWNIFDFFVVVSSLIDIGMIFLN